MYLAVCVVRMFIGYIYIYVFPKIDVLFAGTNVLGKVNLPGEYLSFLRDMFLKKVRTSLREERHYSRES
jgi:hypothetical protein